MDKYTSKQPPPFSIDMQRTAIDATIADNKLLLKSSETAAVCFFNASAELTAIFGPKIFPTIDIADGTVSGKAVVGNGVDSIKDLVPVVASERLLSHTMVVAKCDEVPAEREGETIPNKYLKDTKYEGEKVEIFPVPSAMFIPFGVEIPVGFPLTSKEVADFFDGLGEEAKLRLKYIRMAASSSAETETIYKRMVGDIALTPKEKYFGPGWGTKYKREAHNWAINVDPLMQKKKCPEGMKYLLNTFTKKDETPVASSTGSGNGENATGINGQPTIVIRNAADEAKEETVKLSRHKISIFFTCNTQNDVIDFDSTMNLNHELKAPELQEDMQRALECKDKSSRTTFIQNTINARFEEGNKRDSVVSETGMIHFPKQAASAIDGGMFEQTHIDSNFGEKANLNLLCFAYQSNNNSSALKIKQKEDKIAAEANLDIPDNKKTNIGALIPMAGDKIETIEHVIGLLANVIYATGAMVKTNYAREGDSIPIIATCYEKIFFEIKSREARMWIEKNGEEMPHLAFVLLNVLDKVWVSFAKMANSGRNIECVKRNEWRGIDKKPIRLAINTVGTFVRDLDSWISGNVKCPWDRAPSFTPVNCNPQEQMNRSIQSLIKAQQPGERASTARTKDSNKTKEGTNGGGPANKKPRTESSASVSELAKKGTFISREAGYTLTPADCFGKGAFAAMQPQCRDYHVIGMECKNGPTCTWNHDHIRKFGQEDIDKVVKNMVEKKKAYLNIGLKKDEEFMKKFEALNIPGKEECFGTRSSNGASKK